MGSLLGFSMSPLHKDRGEQLLPPGQCVKIFRKNCDLIVIMVGGPNPKFAPPSPNLLKIDGCWSQHYCLSIRFSQS